MLAASDSDIRQSKRLEDIRGFGEVHCKSRPPFLYQTDDAYRYEYVDLSFEWIEEKREENPKSCWSPNASRIRLMRTRGLSSRQTSIGGEIHRYRCLQIMFNHRRSSGMGAGPRDDGFATSGHHTGVGKPAFDTSGHERRNFDNSNTGTGTTGKASIANKTKGTFFASFLLTIDSSSFSDS